MYEISNALKQQLTKHTRVEHVRGTIGEIPFDDYNVISLTYSNRCSNTDDITFGLAYIGQINVEFCGIELARRNWKRGKKITLDWGVEIPTDDGTVTEWLPVGEFFISSAEWTDSGVSVVANDVLSKLDKAFGGIQTNNNTIGGLARFACQQCNVEFALTDEQAEELPNGGLTLQLYKDNDIKTWRDFIAWLASTAGGYVTATRDGKVTIRSFANNNVVDLWLPAVRIAGATFADYDTAYDGAEYQDIKYNRLQPIYGVPIHGSGMFINIGADPFAQSPGFVSAIARVATSLEWTPFKSALLSNLVYDLGDVVQNKNGLAGSDPLNCCIMSIDWTFKETTVFQGFGADPAIATGKSKTDKALNGAKSQIDGLAIEFTKFVNSTPYTIGATETEIADLKFAVASPVDVEEWGEIKLTASNPSELVIKYYLDGQLITEYSPSESWNQTAGVSVSVSGTTAIFTTNASGGTEADKHTVNLQYHLNEVTNNGYHHWKITATAPTGSATIAAGDVHVILWAQGMVGENDFAGYIPAADSVPFLPFEPLEIIGTLGDTATVTVGGSPSVEVYRTTPDGDYRTTPDGDNRIIPPEV